MSNLEKAEGYHCIFVAIIDDCRVICIVCLPAERDGYQQSGELYWGLCTHIGLVLFFSLVYQSIFVQEKRENSFFDVITNKKISYAHWISRLVAHFDPWLLFFVCE